MSTAASTTAATAVSTAAAIADSTVNSTAGSTSSTTAAATTISTAPWVFQNPFGENGGSTLSGTVGSLFGSSVGAFGTNTSGLGPIPPRMMPPAERPPKFGGSDFKTWQRKMLCFLTTFGLVSFITEDEPPAPSAQETNFTVRGAYENWQTGDYMCRNFILKFLDDSLYNVYAIVNTSKEMWSALDEKYRSDDDGRKKFVVARFLDYKMVDSRPIMEQVDELQLLIHGVHAEGIVLPDAYSVAEMIEKLPPSWREFKSYLKHKRNERTLEWLITMIRIQANFVENQGC